MRDLNPVPVRDMWTYLLVTPDGVLGGIMERLKSLVILHGFTPMAVGLIQLRVDAMKQVYAQDAWHLKNPGHPDIDFSWDMHGKLYGLAPACLILVSRPAGDASRALLAAKGHTRPELGAPDEIRYLSENVIFNYVHCPDDMESALRELHYLLGADDARRIIAYADASSEQSTDLIGIDAAIECLPAFSGRDSVSFPAIVNRIRRRVVQFLALRKSANESLLSELLRAQQELSAEARLLAETVTSHERMEVARKVSASISEDLAAAAAVLKEEVIEAGVRALGEMYNLDGVRHMATVFALADRGIYISPLEKVMIECHCYSFLPSGDLVGIYE